MVIDQQSELESFIDRLCGEIPDIVILASAAPQAKIESLVAAQKASRSKIQSIKVDFEQ